MSALDELLRSWRANPDAEATIALCTALGRADRPDLRSEVRSVAEQWHTRDPRVWLAVGTMFLEAGAWPEAQATLVLAGKADGRRPEAFRYLGEVLLRRGDAARADKVFERALRLDPENPELELWRERARMFLPVQARVGMEAVAREVARTVPRTFTGAPPPNPSGDAALDPEDPDSEPEGFEEAEIPTIPRPDRFGSQLSEATPEADEVLSHLALVGVFEAQPGQPPRWDRPARERNRSSWVLVGAAVLVAGAAVGGFLYARQIADQKIAEAAAICDDVAVALRSGAAERIAGTDEQLSRAFDLDPNSTRAARLWLENRALHWLVGGTSAGLEGAIQRMRRLGAPSEQVAFGTIAVRLAEGDVPGALGVMSTIGDKAKSDPMYQLFAGLALERTGDASCLERYEEAIRGDGTLQVARLLRARALLSMRKAAGVEQALAGIESTSPERTALDLLSDALAPWEAEVSPKDEAALPSAQRLPVYLRWIPELWRARRMLIAGDAAGARKLLGQVLDTVDTPDAAVRVGELALAADNPALVRRAALQAISSSPLHPPARLLAARAAVEAGRFDEGAKAFEGLETAGAEVAALRAVIAYERGDVVALGDALEALSREGKEVPPGLDLLPTLLVGGALPRQLDTAALQRPGTLWGRLILADAALLRGESAVAGERLAALPAEAPPVARRLAQLARLGGKAEEAVSASARSLAGSPTALALLERVLALLAAKDLDGARQIAEAQASLLGSHAPWLLVLVDLEQGRLPRAKARAAALPEPLPESPLALRVVVARAMVGVGDRARGRALLELVRRQAPRHPDVVALPARL